MVPTFRKAIFKQRVSTFKNIVKLLESHDFMEFLQFRENYKLAYHRWENCANQLCNLLNCDLANLEEHLLLPKGHQYWPLAQEYAALSIALDIASDKWDTAQMVEARIIASLNRDLQLLEC